MPSPDVSAPRISILLSFRNGGDALGRAVQSLQWQSCHDWELLLMDDGSDHALDPATPWLGDTRIRLVRHERNRGLPVRLNEAIDLARGDYLARMDADDIAFPERLARQMAFLDAHTDIDLVAASVLLVDADGAVLGMVPCPSSHERICARPWAGFPMPHPTWMGRAGWFRRHRYDERSRKAQDHELLYRSYRTSRFAGLPEPLLAYRFERPSMAKRIVSRYHQVRSLVRQGGAGHLLAGSAFHAAAALRDVGAVGLGWDRLFLRRRGQGVPAPAIEEWHRLQQCLAQSVDGAG